MKISILSRATAGAAAITLMIVGCTPGGHGSVRSASGRAPSSAKAAAQFAEMGITAMRRREGALAVTMAERAVASQPQAARYRAQLGQSYLLAGRFASAIDAFRDAAALAPDDGRVLLGAALAQGALDRQAAARASVDAARGRIPESDRGLALALAGDSDGAIAILEPVARAADATPKMRQNLALAYALAGRWNVARSTAAQDVVPADLDARMAAWAKLAAPQARIDRIAAFLGVTPVAADTGMPMQLALGVAPVMPATVAPAPAQVEMAAFAPVAPVAPVAEVAAETVVPMMTAQATPDTVPAFIAPDVAAPTIATPALVEPRAPTPRRPAVPTMLMRADYMVPAPGRGLWSVQLGAFSSGHSIEDAWDKVRRTVRPVAGMMPLSSTIRTRGMLFQRLAVGGIGSRPEAVALCERVRAARGVCFVRTVTEEAPLRMAAKASPVRIAAR
ncbi:MAG TPA: SPOR domain-containing protein [Sphingomonas sp.]|jgi:Flp pilus assembly protein TadD|uniref:SPOR domain-containing protein n=1 Tax=Sphingomonas sp. TaxID=28214 RepID=UPI002ED8EC2C